jgi:CRP-like cAMP-binding protein
MLARRRPAPSNPRGNRLLSALPRLVREQVVGACETVELRIGDELYAAGCRIRHVYFPTQGFASLVIETDRNVSLEVGLVGEEGMVGTPLVLGVEDSALRALVQGSGSAWRMPSAAFVRLLNDHVPLRRVLGRYVQVQLSQLAQTAACARFHVIDRRLARWLLMSHDRARTDSFDVTHAFLGYMLGVRREGVTQAAGLLQGRNLIEYTRGRVTVLDRRGMERVSCSCYEADRATYARLVAAS